MKVLWLSNIILPKIVGVLGESSCNGGGWLVGLSEDIMKQDNINLSVCCPITNKERIINGKIENLEYYCFPQSNLDPTKYNKDVENYLEEIVKKVNPDIIHIFGTEYPHTLAMVNVCEKLDLLDRIVINIQGLVSVYEKHYYAGLPNNVINRYTLRDILKNDNIKKQKNKFIQRGRFEVEALKRVKHVIGRTDWDKACVTQINPEINYYFCNETLRSDFYNNEWNIESCEKYSIFISQCSYPIKGFHFMLEAMPHILKKYPDAHIYTTGNNPLEMNTLINKVKMNSYQKHIAELLRKLHIEDKVTFLGGLTESDMCQRFLKSHVFVSPSIIENSPNSVGEAMILGVPTISSDVGGVKNMLTHGEDGFIYQHDAPYMLAHYICEIFGNDKWALNFSSNAKKHAKATHSRLENLDTMLNIYESINRHS